jgi:archaellum component FlaC
MREQDLEKIFADYLKNEKGYSDASFLYRVSIHPKIDEDFYKRYIADLIIFDTHFNNYLALIEFKSTATDKDLHGSLYQVTSYLRALNKPDLPAYLVIPCEQDFEIYLLAKGRWNKIEKQDFPNYQTFQSKAEADSKSFFEGVTENKYRYEIKRIQLTKNTAWSALLSMFVGIAAAVLFYTDTIKDDKVSKKVIANVNYQRLTDRITSLENQLKLIHSDDSNLNAQTQSTKLKDLENRITNFEASVSTTPDRLLKLQEISFEFRQLQNSIAKEKELAELKISNLKEKLDQVIIWTSGLIITIFGSIIGFAINAFRKK